MNIHHKHTSIKYLKDKGEKPTVMVHAIQIKETTTLPLPTEEDLRKATSYYCDLRYINRSLSFPEETPIEPKELRNKGYFKPFQQVHMELNNGLISYYDTPRTARVRQIILRGVPVSFILVMV